VNSGVDSPQPGQFDGPAAVAADLAAIRDRIRVAGSRLAALHSQFGELRLDIDRHQATWLHDTDS
jgi:hypothetical protein